MVALRASQGQRELRHVGTDAVGADGRKVQVKDLRYGTVSYRNSPSLENMTTPPVSAPRIPEAVHRRRWAILGVLMLSLLIVSVVGLVAFAPTHASLHDGSGQRDWTPAAVTDLNDHYKLAFGQGVLDLTRLV